jgi:hypothetical protein
VADTASLGAPLKNCNLINRLAIVSTEWSAPTLYDLAPYKPRSASADALSYAVPFRFHRRLESVIGPIPIRLCTFEETLLHQLSDQVSIYG